MTGEGANSSAPGFREGEAVRWRVDEQWAEVEALSWTGDRDLHVVDLDVHEPTKPSSGTSPIFMSLVVK